METSSPEPGEDCPEDFEAAERARLGLDRWVKHARDAFVLGILVHLFFVAGDEISLSRLPPDAFWLAPRGWGFFWEAMAGIGAITGFAVFYTLPAFMVRPWLEWTLRALMFLLFVVFLSALRAEKYVGALQDPEAFTFVRSYPFPSTVVPFDSISDVNVRDTGIVRALSLRRRNETLDFVAVWHADSVGNVELQRLVAALEQHRRRSSKPH